MAESSHHQGLVLRAQRAVCAALQTHNHLICYVDGSQLSDGLPPNIDGFRPDLFAFTERLEIVGEAKPPWDVESTRSERQLEAFLHYVEEDTRRHMVMSVHWTSTATAKSVLRSIAGDWLAVRERVHILDGLLSLTFADD